MPVIYSNYNVPTNEGEHRLRTRGAYYYYFLTAPRSPRIGGGGGVEGLISEGRFHKELEYKVKKFNYKNLEAGADHLAEDQKQPKFQLVNKPSRHTVIPIQS